MKETEKSTREKTDSNAKRLRDITNVLGQGIYVLDKNNKLIFMNPRAEQLLQWTEAELLGKTLHEIIHNKKADGSPFPAKDCPVLKVIQTGKSYQTEDDVFTRKDGTVFPVSYTATPLQENGSITGSVNVFQDIDRRKRVENEQKEAKQLSDALNDMNAAIISTLDFNRIMQRVVIESANAMGCETAGILLRENEYWILRYVHGNLKNLLGRKMTAGEAMASALVYKTKKPVIINDAYSDPRVNQKIVRQYKMRSYLVAPLIAKEEIMGALAFFYHMTATPFTENQVDFANKLAASLSLAVENARLYEVERNIADTLQEALLTAPQKIPGIDFGYLYRSATEATKVGGDFYDLFELEHGKIGIIVGDVSGKGLEAATLTSLVKNTIKAYAYQEGSPSIIISKTNDILYDESGPSIFVTVFFGILDLKSGEITYCNAGHPPAIVRKARGGTFFLKVNSPIIGSLKGLEYKDNTIILNRTDTLILYTDGVIEARQKNQFFGEERLFNFIKGHKTLPLPKILPGMILDKVSQFTGGTLSDDIALLTLKLKPKGGKNG